MKKIVCIILSMLIFSMSLSLSPSALGIEYRSEPCLVEVLEDEYYFPEKNSGLIQSNVFYSNPDGCYAFGDFLEENQKTVYDAIVENKGGLLGEIGILQGTDKPASKIVITFPEKSFIVGKTTMQDEARKVIIAAISAAMDDYPEYFWLGSFSSTFGYGIYDTNHNYIREIDLSIIIDTDSYADWDVIKDCYNRLIDSVNNFKIDGNTRYGKLKSMHDGICKITTYTLNVPMAHQPTGVFLKGQAVCEGYAEAMKLLCDRENIPCIIVVGLGKGGAHEWNYVQMEDGKWYGMDVTWDDQGDIYYDYFLTGSETINAVFGKTKFGNGTDSAGDHIITGTHFNNIDFSLTYPSVSPQSYLGVIQMWNSAATFDNERGFMFIPKDVVANQQILCTYNSWKGNAPNTNAATVLGVTTGGKVNITSPVEKVYTIVRIGDVNKDNSVNVSDRSEIKDITLCKKEAYKDSAQFAAADINGDGSIDAFDAIQLDCILNSDSN